MRDRLQETHGPRFELLRHFLARSFDSDIFSTPGQWRRVAVSAIALALPAGMLLMDPPYYHQPIDPSPATLRAVAIAGELAVLTLLTAVVGGLALLLWESLFPSRLDYHALAGLPLHPRKIFVARFLAVLCMASAVTVAMGMLPAVMLPHQFTAHGGPEFAFGARKLACAAAGWLASFFVFFAVVAIQGALLNVLPAGWLARLAAYVQGALVAVFFLAGLYSFIIDWREPEIARLPDFARWAPPIWFLGLDRVILGDHDPFFATMAARALEATAAAVFLAGLAYVLAYSRYRKLLIESGDAVRRPLNWTVFRFLDPHPAYPGHPAFPPAEPGPQPHSSPAPGGLSRRGRRNSREQCSPGGADSEMVCFPRSLDRCLWRS